MTVRIFKPPHRPDRALSIFLAGSIEMGKAEDWQERVTNFLQTSLDGTSIDIYNPRRDHWDASWEQVSTNPQFNEQVMWELELLEQADIKAFYFDPETKSPVTMLELGLMLAKAPQRCVVCSPYGFWRRGNLDITCQRAGVELHEDMNEFLHGIKKKIWLLS
jgi:hypothetical protein